MWVFVESVKGSLRSLRAVTVLYCLAIGYGIFADFFLSPSQLYCAVGSAAAIFKPLVEENGSQCSSLQDITFLIIFLFVHHFFPVELTALGTLKRVFKLVDLSPAGAQT